MYVKTEDLERRCLPTAELRLDSAGAAPKITGYAAVFNTWADIGGWFRESIRPGAFAKTIKENDIRALLNHDENFVLGRNKAKTLTLREDDKGLAVTIDPVPATWANDLLLSMKRGDVNQMSFGFTVNKAETDFEKDERVLTDVTLFDVSIVTFPAYPTTTAQVRSAFTHIPVDIADKKAFPSERELEHILRDAGFSIKQARTILAKGYSVDLRDAEEADVTPPAPEALRDVDPSKPARMDSVADLIIRVARMTG